MGWIWLKISLYVCIYLNKYRCIHFTNTPIYGKMVSLIQRFNYNACCVRFQNDSRRYDHTHIYVCIFTMYGYRQNDEAKFKVKTVHGPQKVIVIRTLLSSSLHGSVIKHDIASHSQVQYTRITGHMKFLKTKYRKRFLGYNNFL